MSLKGEVYVVLILDLHIIVLILSGTSRYKSSVLVLKIVYFHVSLTASKSRYFVWREDHDVLMLREAVTSVPYNFKPKSSKRGKVC